MGKIAKVTGVLHYNDETREEMLKRINWRDSGYTSMGGDFVRYAEIKDREVSSPTGGLQILEYTFSRNNPYGMQINRDYMGNRIPFSPYEVKDVPNGERWKWEGDYLENFNGDTQLMRIGDMKGVEQAATAIYANENRHLEVKYITPSLLNFYGTSPAMPLHTAWYTLGAQYTGRMPEIPEAQNIEIERDYANFLKRHIGEAPARHMKEMFGNAERQMTKEGRSYMSPYANGEKNSYLDYDSENWFNGGGTDSWEMNRDLVAAASTDFTNRDYASHYNEGDIASNDEGIRISGDISSEPNAGRKNSLIEKTRALFHSHKIQTLSGRFHTSVGVERKPELIDTAKNEAYGNSHGRNLLKKNGPTNENGYENPYCRVWTYHHQYENYTRAIRPFETKDAADMSELLPYSYVSSSRKNTVLDPETGLVNIVPKQIRTGKDDCPSGAYSIKGCMFSIENLAWKDVPKNLGYLSKEQTGPNGGRIMWFPPYDLDFTENVSVSWNEKRFIGRGEPLFTYSNTKRSGTLSFAILIDHPSILDNIPKNNIKNGDNGIQDEDILRFFAGCGNIPELTKKNDCDTAKDVVAQQNPGEEPVAVPSEEKAAHLKFYVFFPNNYSGNGNPRYTGDGEILSEKEFLENGPTDKWVEYLFFGSNTEIAENVKDARGYECEAGKDNGITDMKKSGTSIPVAKEYSPWKEGKGECKNLKYEYRVDFDLHQKLYNTYDVAKKKPRSEKDSNYKDSVSFALNTDVAMLPAAAKDVELFSFEQIIKAINETSNVFANEKTRNIKFKESEKSDERIKQLIDVFLHPDKVSRIELTAGATVQDSSNSYMLEKRRGNTLKHLLKAAKLKTAEETGVSVITCPLEGENATSTNVFEAKIGRYAAAEIWYNMPEVVAVSENTHATTGNGIEESFRREIEENPLPDMTEITYLSGYRMAEQSNISGSRYETEGEYFQRITREDPFIRKTLIDRFKYFSPAFHSISPEGFNARLTFLQQCTRQGHTISASDGGFAKTAGNLSFGRMPVCVLKIGDFLNTKIIINSMSITYGANGNPQWDLNPEGIGVQPMYAKVQLGIDIIGGQSLEGPINRLQNAVSFNYYANTEMYDDRSDTITLDPIADKGRRGDYPTVRVQTREGQEPIKYNDYSDYGGSKVTYTKEPWAPYPDVAPSYEESIKAANESMKKRGASKYDAVLKGRAVTMQSGKRRVTINDEVYERYINEENNR